MFRVFQAHRLTLEESGESGIYCHTPAGSTCPPNQLVSSQCGSRSNNSEPCRRSSTIRLRLLGDSHSVRLFQSCALVALDITELQSQCAPLDRCATSLHALRRSQGGESGSGPADKSQRNTIGVVGPVATQGRSHHDGVAFIMRGRDPIGGLPTRWFRLSRFQ